MSAATREEKRTESPGLPDGLAIRIRQARERKGLTLSDVHKTTGLSRTALHDYESGRTKPGARELIILSETLVATPNWLLFGTEEPLSRKEGLKALIRLRNSPLMTMVSMLVLPAVMTTLQEDELESLLVLISSLLEARNKDAYRQISAAAEVFGELLGTGSPAEMDSLTQRSRDPAFIADMQERIKERLAQIS